MGIINSFWLWLGRFAFKQMQKPYLTKEGKLSVGIPFMRDPDNKCETYSPGKRKTGDPECWGDGHHLCKDCRLFVNQFQD